MCTNFCARGIQYIGEKDEVYGMQYIEYFIRLTLYGIRNIYEDVWYKSIWYIGYRRKNIGGVS